MKKALFSTLLVGLFIVTAFLPGAAYAQTTRCGETYTVQKGDTLASIADYCGLNYVVLININYEMIDPNLIRPGQVIRLTAEIPIYTTPASGPADTAGLQEDGQSYIVRKGDSLARIAYLYKTTVYAIQQVNPELNGSTIIYPGQSIQLPYDLNPRKGWVGISTLEAWAYDEIDVRVEDLIPYADLEFRLHEKVNEFYEGYYNPDLYSIVTEGKTDSQGKAYSTLKVPYWARNGETWVIDVYVRNEGDRGKPVTSPDILITK